MRIINKTGELHNPADRDHCLQYMVAAALTFGELKADHYGDHFTRDPRIDQLRELMHVSEDEQFTADYYDPDKRAIPNSIQIHFEDGTMTEEIVVEYPLGHQSRREESLPFLEKKFRTQVMTQFSPEQFQPIIDLFNDQKLLLSTSVPDFMNLMKKK